MKPPFETWKPEQQQAWLNACKIIFRLKASLKAKETSHA